ncbi:MAG: hypothetical protein QOG64_1559 [Acidimicrobiaceae bacterium]|jgi:ribosomal protein L24E|nr:hypothetical protein [Acidimicrobiaceae bacterium]
MGKRFLSAVAAAVLVICGFLALVSPKPATADSQSDAVAFLAALNQVRTSVGVRPLNVDPRLVTMAQGWSDRMAAAGTISHNPNLAAQGPAGWQLLGENVGMGPDVSSIHDAFVHSPHHYDNMIEPRYNAVGIAVTRANNAIFVTVDFEQNPGAIVTAAQAAPAAVATSGYWLVARDGGIFSYGTAGFHGSTGGMRLNQPIVGMAGRPDHGGYWFVAADGGVFAFSAPFLGSTGAIHLNQPIVGMATTPSGNGYWLVARDGGIFAFGDAAYQGSAGGMRLNQPIVGMASTPSGHGYWLVAADGGVFAFGDAAFHGSTGGSRLNQPIVSVTATPTGNGYWFVAADGGVFAFGDAHFFGSASGGTAAPAVSITPSRTGNGYRITSADGAVYNFGDAEFDGSAAGGRLNQAVVGMAAA